jgi:GT2 family glycosyltransferase
MISPRKLELHVEHFRRSPHLDVSYTTARYFKDGNPTLLHSNLQLNDREWIRKLSGFGYTFVEHLIRRNLVPINSPLFRRSSLERFGIFDETLAAVEDWDFLMRASLAGLYFEYLEGEDAYALIRVHDSSSSQNKFKMVSGHIALRKKVSTGITESPVLSRSEKKACLRLNRRKTVKLYRRQMLLYGPMDAMIKFNMRDLEQRMLARVYVGYIWKELPRMIVSKLRKKPDSA